MYMNLKKVVPALLCAATLFNTFSVFAKTEPANTSSSQLVSSVETLPISSDTAEPSSSLAADDKENSPTASPTADGTENSPTTSPTADDTTKQTDEILPSSTPKPNDTITPETAPEQFSDALGIDLFIEDKMVVTDSTAKFELYDMEGNLLGTDEEWIGSDTDRVYIYFKLPQYRMGTEFKLKLVSGLTNITYYSDKIWPGEETVLQTYLIKNNDGTYFQGNNFILTGCPVYEKGICLYYNGPMIELSPRARIIDGVAMAPVNDLAAAMKLKADYSQEYNSINAHIGSYELLFNIDDTYTTIFGNDTYISHAPMWIDGEVFVPIRDMAEAFGCTLEVLDFDDHLDIILNESPIIREYLNNSLVNKNGISSRTDYLVWVSKSEYTVRVYLGSQYNWELVYECPCAIGAWNTPTIEGQFEYQYRMARWDYGTYYVGPALVFYGGYALHSTLLYYGGGEYDGTVGAAISHGCIRMHPQDINWIDSYIPVGTKIYITG
jgi:hypothetical protein